MWLKRLSIQRVTQTNGMVASKEKNCMWSFEEFEDRKMIQSDHRIVFLLYFF